LSSTAEAAVEAATAEASVRDAERVDADVVTEEVPPAAGQEAEPTATAKGGVVEPPPLVPEEEVPVVEGPAQAEGSTLAMVDLTLDDSP
jgi:hypothetical protein